MVVVPSGTPSHWPSFQIRGIRNADTETTFKKLIAEWARKKRIDNPLTIAQRHTHFEALADFLGHDNGADVTAADIVGFENPQLRRAMSLSIDRQAFIDIVAQGKGEIGASSNRRLAAYGDSRRSS